MCLFKCFTSNYTGRNELDRLGLTCYGLEALENNIWGDDGVIDA